MIPTAHKTISVELLAGPNKTSLSGPEARAFMRMLQAPGAKSEAAESPVRIRIHHYGAKATGGGELIGAVLENGSLRFGSVEVEPIGALRPWLAEILAGGQVLWPPERPGFS